MTHSGRHFLQIPGPTNVPDRVLRAMDCAVIDHRGPDHHLDRLIGSGTLEDVGTAKDAAERMAERLVTARRHRA